MFEGHSLLVDFGVAQGDTLLRIVADHLLDGVATKRLVVGLVEDPLDAAGQVFGAAVVGHVAVLLVVDLLGDAAHLEAYTG